MEDLDLALVSGLLRDGKPALKAAREKGLRPDLLRGKGKDVYQFLVEYHMRFDDLPPLDVIQGKIGFKLPELPFNLHSEFLVDEVFNRKTFEYTLKVRNKLDEQLSATPPNAKILVETLESAVLGLRAEQLTQSKVESLFALGPEIQAHYERLESGERGILTPWAAVNDITLGFWPMDLVLFVARSGVGKCVDESTILTDPVTGIPATIRQVVESNTNTIHTWDPAEGVHTAPITAKVDTGRKECFEVTFDTGRTIIVTPEHPFLSPEGWREASDVRVGQTLALPSRIPSPSAPVRMNPAEVDLLALLLAEGSYTGHHTGFTTSDKVFVDIAKKAAAKIGSGVTYRGRYSYDFVPSNPVDDILNKHKIHKKKAIHKTIPDAVYSLPDKQLSRFLSLFWMCDGYVDGSPGVTLGSKKMVFQLQHLLLRFGVQSRVCYKPAKCNGKKFDSWRLKVYAFSLVAFKKAVPLWGAKLNRLEKLIARPRNSNVGFPRVSLEFQKKVKAIAATGSGRWKGGKLSEVGRRLGWSSWFMVRNLFGAHRSVQMRAFKVFCDVYECRDQFKELLGKDIFWDVVTKITSVGDRKIYDLTVSSTSCFIANDIVVHNTWVAVQLAWHAWQQKKRVLFCTTEMSRLRVGIRAYALMGKFNYKDFSSGRLTIHTKPKFFQMVQDFLSESGLYVVGGNFDFRVESLSAALDEIRPDVMLLDGAYLLRTEGANRTEMAANSFNELKRLGIRHNIPIVATHQFNREVKTNLSSTVRQESIGLTDVAGWNASLIFGMVQSDDMKANKLMRLKPLKAREGVGEEVEINWDLDNMNFSEIGIVSSLGRGGGDSEEFGSRPIHNQPADNSDIPF